MVSEKTIDALSGANADLEADARNRLGLGNLVWFGAVGGFLLPFLERLGEAIPRFDFRVPGVSTISADVHKYGYCTKGASVILHRS